MVCARKALFAAVLIAGLSATNASAGAAPEPSELLLRFHQGLLSIEARGTSWAKLLDELSHRTGIILQIRLPLDGLVTVSLHNLPVERALEQLFGREVNFLYVYSRGHQRQGVLDSPSEVWIFGRAQAGNPISSIESSSFESSEPAASAALDETNDTTRHFVETFESNPRTAQNFAQWHPDPGVQRIAITYLGEQSTAEAIEVLLVLLQDRESSVRQNALEALGPLVQRHREVRERLIKILERTEHSDTRQLLADSLGVSLDKIKPGQPMTIDTLDDGTN
jgi:hypothetical protein